MRNFYKFAVIDGYIEKSPAEHVRKPRAYRDESRTLGLDRDELLLLLRTAQASSPMHGALIGLMGLLGLRVSEACSVKIEDSTMWTADAGCCTSLEKGRSLPPFRCLPRYWPSLRKLPRVGRRGCCCSEMGGR